MLKVALDVRALGSARKSGVENYVHQLADELPKHSPNTLFYFFADAHSKPADLNKFKRKNVKIIRLPSKSNEWFFRLIKVAVRVLNINIAHFTVGYPPKNFPVPTVMNIHDLTFELYPEIYEKTDLENQRLVTKNAKNASGIIAISENTKRDIIRFCQVDPEKVFITYLGLRNSLGKQSKGKAPYSFPYLLAVGNIQPRKNFVKSVEALAQISDKTIHLVIVGKMQDEEEGKKVIVAAKKHGLENRIHITGYVEDELLSRLYANAKLLLFPSIYEGFGYPVIEAFESRTPVVSSNTSSLPEIGGDAVEYCDPSSPKSIALAIEKILNDADYSKRLVKKGLQRLEKFNGKNLATETFKVYESLRAKK